jgi:hypothetical protein
MKPVVLAAALFAAILPSAHAAAQSQPVTQAEAQAFFKRMGELNMSFDEKYADLYADDASITGRKHDTGETQTVTGAQWKQLMLFNLPKAKKRDDRSSFSKARYEPLGERMKIRAERYVLRKCNTDPDYTLTLGRQPDGRILIVEESFALSVPNLCK